MIRHKPSDKTPEDSQLRVVIKLIRRKHWDVGRYFKSSDQFEIMNMLYPHTEFHFSDEVEWWGDPMDEE